MKNVPLLLAMMIAGAGPSEEHRAACDAEVSRIARKAERQAYLGESVEYHGYSLMIGSSSAVSKLIIQRSGDNKRLFEEDRPGRHLMRDFGDLRAWVEAL